MGLEGLTKNHKCYQLHVETLSDYGDVIPVHVNKVLVSSDRFHIQQIGQHLIPRPLHKIHVKELCGADNPVYSVTIGEPRQSKVNKDGSFTGMGYLIANFVVGNYEQLLEEYQNQHPGMNVSIREMSKVVVERNEVELVIENWLRLRLLEQEHFLENFCVPNQEILDALPYKA